MKWTLGDYTSRNVILGLIDLKNDMKWTRPSFFRSTCLMKSSPTPSFLASASVSQWPMDEKDIKVDEEEELGDMVTHTDMAQTWI